MTDHISRRGLLGVLTATTAAACSPKPSETYTAENTATSGFFSHGIASGDPLTNAVILWTRIEPSNPEAGPVELTWEMAQDANFENLSASGTMMANRATNWTAKVDAAGLDAGTSYFYRFRMGDQISPVGQTKTIPEGALDQVRFAVVSCSNWQHGLFSVYDHISRQDHFDAVLHLGDYFYEYGEEKATGAAREMGRLHEPTHEIISLDDYRTRHAQYRSDPNLQALTAKLPLISIWDDHESSNDSWSTGAENHQPDEGDWSDRKRAALRAYYEWMPIREPKRGRTREAIFRKYEWGDLLTLITLETRLLARGEPIIVDDHFDSFTSQEAVDDFKSTMVYDPDRDMLGQAQTDFIATSLKDSKAAGKPWRVLANQVIMGRLVTPDMTPYIDESAILSIEAQWAGIRQFVETSQYGLPLYLDSWDGYPVAREKFFTRLKSEGIEDIIVLTGDAHEYWINDLTTDAGDKIGIELVTSSVSSETLGVIMGETVRDYALLMTQTNADARYYNAEFNGYIDLHLTRTKGTASFVAVNDVLSESYEAFETASFTLRPSKNTVKATNPKGLNIKQRALFSGLG